MSEVLRLPYSLLRPPGPEVMRTSTGSAIVVETSVSVARKRERDMFMSRGYRRWCRRRGI